MGVTNSFLFARVHGVPPPSPLRGLLFMMAQLPLHRYMSRGRFAVCEPALSTHKTGISIPKPNFLGDDVCGKVEDSTTRINDQKSRRITYP
jgi:hypothetical protein